MIDPDGTGQSGVVWKKDGVCTWSRDTTNRILVFCTYLYVVAEQTLSISVLGTAQLTTGIIKHTIGFFYQ